MSKSSTERSIRELIYWACATEVRAFKPGNVSVMSPGYGMTANTFFEAASAICAPMGAAGISVGHRILRSVQASKQAVHCNANLGIILLCAPLSHAALSCERAGQFRTTLNRTLLELNVDDAVAAYRAICLASPSGLGVAPREDVRSRPNVTLLEAMRLSAGRDRIAYQYAHFYEDIFELGVPTFVEAFSVSQSAESAAVAVFFAMLSHFPDSHISRKYGDAVAEDVCARAREICSNVGSTFGRSPVDRLWAFDRYLKSNSLNPGTSADLTVATLVAACCVDNHDPLRPLFKNRFMKPAPGFSLPWASGLDDGSA